MGQRQLNDINRPEIVPSCRTRSGIQKATGFRLPPERRRKDNYETFNKTRQRFIAGKKADEFERALLERLPPAHPLRKRSLEL